MQTRSVLTIGNSFSQDGTHFLREIASSGESLRVDLAHADLGGCSLERHWNHTQICLQDPTFKPYQSREGDAIKAKSYTLVEALQDRPWDVVTMQQVSHQSWRPASYQPYFDNLLELVRTHAPSADVLIQETWAYREDSSFLPEKGLTQERMYEKLHAAYAAVAAAHGLRVIPSGTAIQNARRIGGAYGGPDENYDYVSPTFPELPTQERSFNVGWHWRMMTSTGLPELANDPNHCNDRGRFLAACTWYETLGGDARETTFCPKSMAPDDAEFLRGIAHDTVQ